MKLLVTTILATTILTGAGYAQADDFGARFDDRAPAAFGETAPADEFDVMALQAIAPAAGEENNQNQGYRVRSMGPDDAGLVRIYPDQRPSAADLEDAPLSP